MTTQTAELTAQPELLPTRPRSSAALQRGAGIAALVKAATFLVGFGVLGAYLIPRGFLDAQGDPAASLQFLLDNQVAMYSWYLVLYLVGGVALVRLVLGVKERLREAPVLARTAEVYGDIWAGLLLTSGMVQLTRPFPLGLAALGTAVGVTGMLTLLPAAGDGGAVPFGL